MFQWERVLEFMAILPINLHYPTMESKETVEPVLIIETEKTPLLAKSNNESAQPARSLPSLARTPESGYPLGVGSNGARVSGNRTSTSSDVKPSRKQKREQERQNRWRCIYRPLVQLFLFLNGFVILYLTWSIFDNLLKLHITAARVWEFLPQPVDPHFDRFSISSSSETCNEFAREWAQADKNVMFVSFFLTYCLSLAEPHNTGLGDTSVSVFGDATKNSCYYMDGSATSMRSIAKFRGALLIEPNSEHIGAYSVAIPGELSNIWAMAELYAKEGDKDPMPLLNALSALDNDTRINGLRLPVSASLARTLEAANMDSQMVFRKKFARNVFGDQLEPLAEGSLFVPDAEYMTILYNLLMNRNPRQQFIEGAHIVGIIESIIGTINSASFDGKGYEATSKMMQDIYWKESLNAFEPTVGESMKPVDVGGGISGCVSRTGGKGTLQPRTPEHMKNFRRPNAGKSTPPTEDIRIYEAIFESIDALQNSTVNQPSDFFTHWISNSKRWKGFLTSVDATEKQRVQRIEPHAPWTASMLAVVDHRSNQAFARTGTLGAGFGSLLQVPKHTLILNNLMSQFGRYNSEVKGHQNDLQPMILFKNGKILTAYAGSGGYLTRSLDLARQFTSLIFSVFYDVPLAKALTTPLHFALPDKKHFLSRGLPYSYANEIRRHHQGETVLDEEGMIDMAAAVHSGHSVFFNGDDDVIEGQVMPNGF